MTLGSNPDWLPALPPNFIAAVLGRMVVEIAVTSLYARVDELVGDDAMRLGKQTSLNHH